MRRGGSDSRAARVERKTWIASKVAGGVVAHDDALRRRERGGVAVRRACEQQALAAAGVYALR